MEDQIPSTADPPSIFQQARIFEAMRLQQAGLTASAAAVTDGRPADALDTALASFVAQVHTTLTESITKPSTNNSNNSNNNSKDPNHPDEQNLPDQDMDQEFISKHSHFFLSGFLGRGQAGSVFLAQDDSGHPVFAIKAIHLPRAVGVGLPIRRTFVAYQTVLRSIDHPHINKYLGWTVLHNEGQIYTSDIKPSNILLHDKSCRIADLGSARIQQHCCANPHQKKLSGTAVYAAPEAVAGQCAYETAAEDIWGLGCILYEIAMVEQPWTDCENIFSVYYQIGTLYTEAMRNSQGDGGKSLVNPLVERVEAGGVLDQEALSAAYAIPIFSLPPSRYARYLQFTCATIPLAVMTDYLSTNLPTDLHAPVLLFLAKLFSIVNLLVYTLAELEFLRILSQYVGGAYLRPATVQRLQIASIVLGSIMFANIAQPYLPKSVGTGALVPPWVKATASKLAICIEICGFQAMLFVQRYLQVAASRQDGSANMNRNTNNIHMGDYGIQSDAMGQTGVHGGTTMVPAERHTTHNDHGDPDDFDQSRYGDRYALLLRLACVSIPITIIFEYLSDDVHNFTIIWLVTASKLTSLINILLFSLAETEFLRILSPYVTYLSPLAIHRIQIALTILALTLCIKFWLWYLPPWMQTAIGILEMVLLTTLFIYEVAQQSFLL
eukprot:jgi/Hompol1/5123/HPOL_000434-RA